MNRPLRVVEALLELKTSLDVPSPDQESHWILMDVLGVSFTELLLHKTKTLSESETLKMRSYRNERNAGKPLAYVLGHQDFYKSRFYVNEHVLIPRPETELIVELASARGPFESIADLGAGSGCVGLSLLKEFRDSRLWTCDISSQALEVCERNAKALQVDARLHAETGSVADFVFDQEFDLVVSNPPYIATTDQRVDKDVLNYEPHTALFAPENGLFYYREWSLWAWKALKPQGIALFEIGVDQRFDVEALFRSAGFKKITTHKDLFGIDRVVCAVKEL